MINSSRTVSFLTSEARAKPSRAKVRNRPLTWKSSGATREASRSLRIGGVRSFHMRTLLNSDVIDDDVTTSAALDTWPDSESSVRRYQASTPNPHVCPRCVSSPRMVFFVSMFKSIGVCVTRSEICGGFSVTTSVSLTTSPVCASAPLTSMRISSNWASQVSVVCAIAGTASNQNVAAPITQAQCRILFDMFVPQIASTAHHMRWDCRCVSDQRAARPESTLYALISELMGKIARGTADSVAELLA